MVVLWAHAEEGVHEALWGHSEMVVHVVVEVHAMEGDHDQVRDPEMGGNHVVHGQKTHVRQVDHEALAALGGDVCHEELEILSGLVDYGGLVALVEVEDLWDQVDLSKKGGHMWCQGCELQMACEEIPEEHPLTKEEEAWFSDMSHELFLPFLRVWMSARQVIGLGQWESVAGGEDSPNQQEDWSASLG